MSIEKWLCAVVVVATLATLALAPPLPPAPLLSHPDPALSGLESRVGADRADRGALRDLTRVYLRSGEPGLAQAALRRSASEVSTDPSLADLQARTLLELGRAGDAYEMQRRVLVRCAEVGCSRTLEARARWRARLLDELLRLGIEDPARDQERAALAYRRSVREVRLAAR